MIKDFIETILRVRDVGGTEVLILPLSFSLGQIINTILLWTSFDMKYKFFSNVLWKTIFHSGLASILSGVIAFQLLRVFDDVFNLSTLLGVFMQGFLSGIIGILGGVVVLILLKNEEIMTVWKTLHKKVWKARFMGGE